MEKRQNYLKELQSYVDGVDKELTMILQSLQWDRKDLMEGSTLVTCTYDPNHRVPPDKKVFHEKKCFLKNQGYAEDDKMLPDPIDDRAPTVVRLSTEDITQIIARAAQADPSFRRGLVRCAATPAQAPLTGERLQATYTADERRAIHDAVVSAAPDLHDIQDLALPGSSTSDDGKKRAKTKLEVLAELRNMRRRRTKYRGANTASNNYSDVLRDLIKTQMELYTGISVKEEPDDSEYKTTSDKREQLERKHHHDIKDNRQEKYTNRNKTEGYAERGHSRDGKGYDGHKEKHRKRDNDSYSHAKHEDQYKYKKDTSERYHRKESKDHKGYSQDENGHSSFKSKDRIKKEDDRSERDKYSARRHGSHGDGSESGSNRRYYDDRGSSSSRTSKRHHDYEDQYADSEHRRDSSRRDERSYETKRKHR